ncbi:MAG: HAMP domain-containing histidine kinase, partial [Planctomycetota bacterium]|nr:HAMP domain-containing histidine kinase [Planctomycetota bacterium]
SAAALVDVLLQREAPAGLQRLDEALRLDAALALWTICRCSSHRTCAPSFDLLVADLLSHLPACLEWPDEQPFDEPAALVDSFAQLAADSVDTARQAEKRASADGAATRDQAYLLGLLSSAQLWLQRCGGQNITPADVLPAYLRLSDATSPVPTDPSETVREPDLPAIREAAGDRRSEAESHRWWKATVGLVRILPELSRRMTRLQRLEEEFAATLEDAKLKALYSLAAGAGHEINNPLGSIAGRAQLLLRDENDAERRRTLAKINSQAFRAHEMISDMMLFAKPPQPVREPVDLVPLAQQVLDSLRELAGQRNTALACESLPQPIMLHADPAQISVALRAMCLNSIEALGGGGRVEIRLGLVGEGSSRCVEITVHDDGPGISPQQREHIFDPFYSGREAGRGLGFGLSKSWRIVQNHGGRIDVQSAPGHGSTFRICLPAA